MDKHPELTVWYLQRYAAVAMDLTPVLNELLKGHDAKPTLDPSLALQNIDEFLKEAYRIVSLLLPLPDSALTHAYRTRI